MNYLRERLSFFPWMLIPVFIYYLGKGSEAAFDAGLLVLVLEFVLFLRVLDDYACFEYDRKQGKSRPYLQRGKKALGFSMLWLGALLALLIYLVLPTTPSLVTVAFLALHVPVYLALRGRPAILAVSLVKYPFLFFLVATQTGQEQWWWPSLGALYFITREAYEEIAGRRNQALEIFIALGLVLAKILSEIL
jgi:4-hydroxybenzoate polyprenyltransferase